MTTSLFRRRKRIDAFGMTGGRPGERIARYRTVSDLFEKRWMEGAVPLVLALALCVYVLATTNVGAGNAPLVLDEVCEYGLLAIGLTVVLVGGGIDLSVGSMVGVCGLGAMVADRVWLWPTALVVPAAIGLGALLGSVNGYLIAVRRMRPFITTLVTLIAFGGAAAVLQNANSTRIGVTKQSLVWDFLSDGRIAGVPAAWFLFAVVLVAVHLALTRSRWGWWVTATGSDRRSARRNGIPVTAVTFWTYVLSGALAGTAAILTSARLGRTDPNVGRGWEIIVLTAVVLGGVSIKGGRGSVLRATVGVVVVAIIQQATVADGVQGSFYTVILAAVLLVFTVLDLKWGKYRQRAVEKLKIDPARLSPGPLIDVTAPGTVWSPNRRLTDAPPVGLGKIRGAEDCAVDAEGNVYCGDQRGWVWRFRGIEDTEGEIFARTGGFPCGHAWDTEGRLVVAVGGMGIYRIGPDGEPELVANQVKRSPLSLIDDSGLRAIDDLDIAPDGSIYASDFSTRTNTADFLLELVEFRPNGRVIRVDPDGRTEVVVSNYVFPNGVCTAHDGRSILIASTGLCRVDRLWIDGPEKGRLEPVLENLPGYPDNINRSSDGNYWMPLCAMRTQMSDLLGRYPAVRRRMTREVSVDNWVVPQLNVSCAIKFSDRGEILAVLWDETMANYPMVTAVKERDGHLYLCGVSNNRIGRLELDPREVGDIDPSAVPGTAAARPVAEVPR
ncbi:ABC transporter permease [Amycolatopsis australiensis]|uniref:Monosaccharide ABC transporter membrane protein, CUT2 family n=1 Tax=Amycolatopsis australiensis TaxID=546364 RepID=A0A1K1S646_9PSEU|nr:SMP-30/gluconolactonase/LRE family protein [Amycolatopsis australiensis]SFW79825.1 monosaccharide ABC transporter membrane protein, CUT2 family [Amycolatopsis australiensis]